ncbi:hypothetical protein WJX82_007868 [Trebouxia sp. C0006]
MRGCSLPISNQQKLIGGLVASAVLAFVVAFAKFNGDTSLLPAVLDRSFWNRRTLPVKPVAAPVLPPVVLKTCNWGNTHRHNLVIVIVGDTSEHERWLDDSASANWDLAVIYYGKLKSAFTCEKCMHIELGSGAKWKLIYQFTQSGAFAEHYVHRYTQVYIPDDDIVQLSSSIDRAFDIQEVYGLDLAQPSLCSRIESDSVHGQGMYMESPTILRYGTFVEIMVPLFSMDFFKGNVTDTLSTSASGHGLDWVWPFLLGYPQDKIAVIDDVCVIHPKKTLQREGKTSMYDTNPHFLGWQTEEEKIQFEKYGYAAKPCHDKYGMGYLERARLGQIWQPWYAALMEQGGLVEQFGTNRIAQGPIKGVTLVQPVFSPTPWQWPQTALHAAPSQSSIQGRAADLLIVLVIYAGKQPRWLTEPAAEAWNVVITGMWDDLVVDKHKYLYFPEEGVIQDVSAISTMLQLSMSNHLDLAHLTWCSALDTQADFMMYMLISPVVVLRYGTYVDIAAPLFSWSFLQQIVLPTLVEAQSGEGLGFLWPYLAGYPMDKIAVIDAACAMRPGRPTMPWVTPQPKQLKLQILLQNKKKKAPPNPEPLKLGNEGQAQMTKFGYDPIGLGKPVKTKQVVGLIEQPWYTRLMKSGSFQAVSLHKWQVTALRTDQEFVQQTGQQQ